MADHLPAIAVLVPMFAALITALVGMKDERVGFPIAVASLGGTLLATVALLRQVIADGPVSYFMAGWSKYSGIGIELRVDSLNACVLVVIASVALLTAVYSCQRVAEETPGRSTSFYTLYLLLCAALMGMSVTADAFNLFVLIEVSSLTSYGLVAMGQSKRGTLAAFNYIIMGTIGASFYLLGVGYLYMSTGTLDMSDIHAAIVTLDLADSKTVLVAFVLITVGIWIKMAFFPLYGWLPNAYTFAPSTSGCILAPLMTKVSVYVMIRIMLTVFGAEYVFEHLHWSRLIVVLATIAIVAGSVLALAQKKLKKMLCYLIVAEVGYMVGGVWLGNHNGIVGASYHVISDAFMTLCLFLAAGIFFRRIGSHTIDEMEGLFSRMPITMAAFAVGALAMIGVPPTCGFFSKWYLVQGGIAAGHWEYVAALLFSSLVNAILFFRIFEVALFGKKPAEGHGHDSSHDHVPVKIEEARPATLIPLIVSAIAIILIGVFNSQIVEIIELTIPATGEGNAIPSQAITGGVATK
jgi:multicomponent Na+:H+ antiporter subunit D